jgi:hypothetical protein
VVYEDSSTESRVDEFCQGLSLELGQNCRLDKQMWPLSELRMPQLRAIAANEAANADLIIVSVHPAERLPDAVQSWIDLWARRKGNRPGVLLALFDLSLAKMPSRRHEREKSDSGQPNAVDKRGNA